MNDDTTESRPWRGALADALDRTTRQHIPLDHLDVVEATTIPANRPLDRLAALSRCPPIGAAAYRQALRSWLTEHPEQRKLEKLWEVYETKHEVYDTKEALVAHELHNRRVAFGLAVLVVLVVVLVIVIKAAWTWLALAFIGGAILTTLKGNAVQRAAAVVVEPAQVATPSPGTAAVPPDLSTERFTAALRTAKLIEQDQEVETSSARLMPTPGGGWSVVIKMPAGKTARSALKKHEDLCGALDVEDRACLLLDPVPGNARRFRLWLADRDPMTGYATDSPLIDVAEVNVWKPIPLGFSSDGRPVTGTIVNGVHWLFNGDTGSGKSAAACLLPLAVALDPHAKNMIFDPQDSIRWKPYGLVGEVYQGRNPEAMRAMAARLRWLWTVEFERRAQAIASYAEKYPMKVPDDKLTEEMARNADLDLPFLLVTLDECHTLYADRTPFDPNDDKSETCGSIIARAALELISRGRRVGIGVNQVTQKASGKNINTDCRDLATARACGSVQTPESATMALGPGWQEEGMNPTALVPGVNAGAFYVKGNGLVSPRDANWVFLRFDYLDANANRIAIERTALPLRQRVRPELLPDDAPVVASAPVADPALDILLALFDHHEAQEMGSRALMDGLRLADPGRYKQHGRNGLNKVVESYGLRTHRLTDRTMGLTRAEVAEAKCRANPGQTGGDPDAPNRFAGTSPGAETGPDLRKPEPPDDPGETP